MRTTRRSATLPAEPDEELDTDPALAAETDPQDEPAADDESHEARRKRIAERAYRRAEQRGFAPGQELDDWLAAEAEERDRADGAKPRRRGADAS
jgi:hypothetical protein